MDNDEFIKNETQSIREISDFIIDAIRRGQLEGENYRPRVGESWPYNKHELIPLELRTVRWNEIRIQWDREIAFPEPLELSENRIPEESIENDWSKFDFKKCAWYHSYHHLDYQWGIHIMEDCWISIAQKLWKYKSIMPEWNLSYNPADALKAALFFLFFHEIFHYMTDICASIYEILENLNKPSWRAFYLPYINRIYWEDFFNNRQRGALEEALSNRNLYGRFRTCKINKIYLYFALKGMPLRGYKDFDMFCSGIEIYGPRPKIFKTFLEGRRELMSQIIFLDSKPKNVLPLDPLLEPRHYDVGQLARGEKLPIYLHLLSGRKQRIRIL